MSLKLKPAIVGDFVQWVVGKGGVHIRKFMTPVASGVQITDANGEPKVEAFKAIEATSAGTAYSLTATSAALAFGTTQAELTIDRAGKWLIQGVVNMRFNGATFASSRTVTLKLRRTNNTAGDLTNGGYALITGVQTTATAHFATFVIPPTVYTTSNVNDLIKVFADVSVVPSAGSLDATFAKLVATPVR